MSKIYLTIIFILSLFLYVTKSNAQVTQLTIGVDGFTCSLCAKGVEGQFKALDFVKSVKTNLKETTFTLIFKSSPPVDITKIQDAVNDGGFSVRDINVVAKGSLKGDANSGFVLITNNSPEINLSNVNGNFSSGDNIEVKGKVDQATNSISVTSMKKL